MVPLSLLRYSVQDRQVLPRYLGPHDHAWLRALLDEYERFVGRPRGELRQRLTEPLAVEAAPWRVLLAAHVLDRLWRVDQRPVLPPTVARAALFGAAAVHPKGCAAARGAVGTRAELVREVADTLGISGAELEELLFADLPDLQRLGALAAPPSPLELGLRTNLAMAQCLLLRATAVRVRLAGRARDLVRAAKWRGLVCVVLPGGPDEDVVLEISGPLALFRRTVTYGKALASLVPLLSWCNRFTLEADCLVHELPRTLMLRTGDPIFPSVEPRPYDSALERRFAKEFAATAPRWNVIREPEPVPAGSHLIFPDFALEHRSDPGRRWLLEIVGFWTPAYLAEKLTRLRQANVSRLILCIDEERNCTDEDLPTSARVVRFRRRIDPEAVRAIVEGEPSGEEA